MPFSSRGLRVQSRSPQHFAAAVATSSLANGIPTIVDAASGKRAAWRCGCAASLGSWLRKQTASRLRINRPGGQGRAPEDYRVVRFMSRAHRTGDGYVGISIRAACRACGIPMATLNTILPAIRARRDVVRQQAVHRPSSSFGNVRPIRGLEAVAFTFADFPVTRCEDDDGTCISVHSAHRVPTTDIRFTGAAEAARCGAAASRAPRSNVRCPRWNLPARALPQILPMRLVTADSQSPRMRLVCD